MVHPLEMFFVRTTFFTPYMNIELGKVYFSNENEYTIFFVYLISSLVFECDFTGCAGPRFLFVSARSANGAERICSGPTRHTHTKSYKWCAASSVVSKQNDRWSYKPSTHERLTNNRETYGHKRRDRRKRERQQSKSRQSKTVPEWLES